MFKKQFVSVYFLKNRIQILQLNGSKSKVEKIASVSLPKDVIVNNTIKDTKTLSKILSSAWSKLKIKEKTVGIVVPEFASFTKLILLPGLKASELGEAIDWQSQDFLPSGNEEMALDWKVVNKEGDKLVVMAVAIKKNILFEYVKAAEDANLLPIVVETPSLSLSRLIENEVNDVLTIYTLHDEGLLVVTKNGGVLGSSVIFKHDSKEILTTAKRILSHFDVEVKKVFVAGVDINQDLVEDLKKGLNQEFSMIDIKVGGMNPETINEYLIPLSLQYKKAFEPADPRTVNLLPAPLVKKYNDKKLGLQVWGATLTLTLFVWMAFLSVLGTYLFLTQQISAEKSRVTTSGSVLSERRETVDKVHQINNTVKKVDEIKKIYLNPQTVLNEINRAKPPGVSINSYEMDFDKGDFLLTGVSTDRESLFNFKTNLENNSKIMTVNIPISSFEVEQNLEFSARVQYDVVSKEAENE